MNNKVRVLTIAGNWLYGAYHTPEALNMENNTYSMSQFWVMIDDPHSRIRRETISWWTGLHDKNGREIYAGDAYTWLGYEVMNGKQIRPKRTKVVGIDVDSFIQSCFEVRNILSANTSLEVVGNIWQKDLGEGK